MPLKITKSTEPIEVKRITMCLYAVPGVGKTATASTAEKPLLLDFDRGSHRTKNRGDVVQIERWDEVLNITAEDLAPYKTVIVDTAGRALDILTPKLIAADPKMGRGGALTLPGYGKLKSEFTSWLKMLHSFGLDVILISHSDEKQNGDDLIERLDMQGASKNEIYKSADVMGRLYLKNGKRTLNFSPADTSFGKNPAGLPPLEVPDFNAEPQFLAGVIAQIKASLNELSAAQMATAALQAKWKARIDAAATVEDFTALIEPIKAADESVRDAVKLLIVKAAKDKGYGMNEQRTAFFDRNPPKTEAKTEPPKVDPGTTTVAESAASIVPETTGQKTDSSISAIPAEDKGDAPTAAEMAAKGQAELLPATRGRRGRAA